MIAKLDSPVIFAKFQSMFALEFLIYAKITDYANRVTPVSSLVFVWRSSRVSFVKKLWIIEWFGRSFMNTSLVAKNEGGQKRHELTLFEPKMTRKFKKRPEI